MTLWESSFVVTEWVVLVVLVTVSPQPGPLQPGAPALPQPGPLQPGTTGTTWLPQLGPLHPEPTGTTAPPQPGPLQPEPTGTTTVLLPPQLAPLHPLDWRLLLEWCDCWLLLLLLLPPLLLPQWMPVHSMVVCLQWTPVQPEVTGTTGPPPQWGLPQPPVYSRPASATDVSVRNTANTFMMMQLEVQ